MKPSAPLKNVQQNKPEIDPENGKLFCTEIKNIPRRGWSGEVDAPEKPVRLGDFKERWFRRCPSKSLETNRNETLSREA